MRSLGAALLALLAAPSGWAHDEACPASGVDASCPAKEQSLLQSQAALHVSRIEGKEFWKNPKKHDKEARRRHLNAVLEQASAMVRRGASAEDLAAAGEQMEAIDEKVLPEIMAEHKQASLLLALQWDAYEVAEGFVDREATSLDGYSRHARMLDEAHLNCRVKEGALLKTVDNCRKELRTLEDTDALEHSVLDSAIDEEGHLGEREAKLGAIGNYEAVRQQHSKMDVRVAKAREGSSHAQHLHFTKENHCNLLSAQMNMQRAQCTGDQYTSEQEWCLVQNAVIDSRGKLADGYAMALSQYESAASHAQVDEAARKAEFGTVEVLRCLKDRFLAAEKGSVADPAWLHQCEKAMNESSGLDLSYNQPRTTAVTAVMIAPADTPCSPAFLRVRDSALPVGIAAAPCTPCKILSKLSLLEHAGHSEQFWTGFHKGVHAATGDGNGDASHVEHFKKKFADEGSESNLARFRDSFAQKVLDRLPSEWGGILDKDLHYGFMNGMEVGIDLDVSEAGKRRQVEEAEESQEKVAGHLAQAAKALQRAKEKVEAVSPKNTRVIVSSGFKKASESAKVLPPGEV